MGYMRHHAIIVTAWRLETIEAARAAAIEIGCTVTETIQSPVNCYWTFLIGPDGSKEGWSASEDGDRQRDRFVEWIETHTGDDHNRWLEWVEVQYGDDAGIAALIRGDDENLIERTNDGKALLG